VCVCVCLCACAYIYIYIGEIAKGFLKLKGFEGLYALAHFTTSPLSIKLLATFKCMLDAIGGEAEQTEMVESILPALKKTLLTSRDGKEQLRAVACIGMLAQGHAVVAEQVCC